MKKPHSPLILKVTSGRIPSLVVSLLFISVLLGTLTFVYEIDGILKIWDNYKRSGYAIAALAYIIYISRIIQNAHEKQFKQLLTISELSESDKTKENEVFLNHRNLWPESLVALLIGFGHSYWYILKGVFEGTSDLPYYDSWRSFQIILVWIIITQSISIYTRNMTLMNRLSQKIKIDLLNLDKLMPLTKAGIISILAFIGAYSILFSTGIDLSDLSNPAVVVLVPTIVIMLHRPLKGIRKRIAHEKEREVKIIDRAIDGDIEALKDSRIGGNLENINVIDLINCKKIIQNTLELPVNIPTASRFVFYLIIPLLTWVAASFVDKLVDYLIK